MSFSKSWGYAIRALVAMAKTYGTEKKWQASDLAEITGLPTAFLPKVLQQLSAAKVVSSTRGRGGGVQLAVSPKEIRLLDVLNAIDEDVDLVLEKAGFEEADKDLKVVVEERWRPVRTATLEFLTDTTLADLI